MRARSGAHWHGLDGLRALAVIAVVVYHFSPLTLPGGFFGVDIFFVISGYLITRLLATEFLARGRIDVPQFYLRRARRLLPALALLLAVVSVAALVWRDQLATVRGGVLSTAVFGGNWWLAFDHQSYFVSTGRPSMLQHLWSLGVEEQFYLVWPLVAAATLAAGRRTATRRGLSRRHIVTRLSLIAVTLSVGSTALTWLLADAHNVPYGNDGSTLYYGTDTHCMGLLLGAALGAWSAASLPRTAQSSPSPAWLQPAADACGGLALAGLLWVMIGVANYSHSLYRGDFLLVAALVVVVIAAATRSGSVLGRWLDIRPLRWVGVRSYSIYLWHWPIAVVTRPGIDTTMPLWLDQLLRVALTVGFAAASYRFVETPVRRLGFRAAFAAVAAQVRTQWRRVPPRPSVAGPVAMAALLCVGVTVIVVGPAAPRLTAASSSGVGGQNLSLSPPHHVIPTTPSSGSGPGTPRPTPIPLPKLSGFGDSVLLGARQALAQVFPGGTIDAIEARQPDPILADVRRDARKGSLEPLVLLHVGNNGLIDPDQLRQTLQLLSGAQLVLVLTDHLDPYDHTWQKPNNETIDNIVPQFANAKVVDWNEIAGEHPGWLYPDDLHLRPNGATAYAKLIAASYRADLPRPSPQTANRAPA
jgi:peptidoglycan/LPS O-acetylase OafA/YrhL